MVDPLVVVGVVATMVGAVVVFVQAAAGRRRRLTCEDHEPPQRMRELDEVEVVAALQRAGHQGTEFRGRKIVMCELCHGIRSLPLRTSLVEDFLAGFRPAPDHEKLRFPPREPRNGP